jgi:hypothetical protein
VTRAKKIALGVVVGLPLVCCLGGYLTIQGMVRRAMNSMPADLAELRRQGFPTEPADLDPATPIPLNQNAAPLYLQATKLLAEGKPADRLADQVGKGMSAKATAKQRQEAEAAFAKLGDVVALAERAADRPVCHFSRDWRQGAHLIFPEYASIKGLAKLLAYKAERQSEAGDWRGALVSIRRSQKISQHVGNDPTLIGLLVQIACESISMSSFRHVIDRHDGSAAFLAEARKVHAGFGPLADFRRAMGGEFVMVRATIQGLSSVRDVQFLQSGEGGDSGMKGSPLDKMLVPMKGAFEAKYIHEYRQLVPDLPRDPEKWQQAQEATERSEKRVSGDQSLFGVMNQIFFPVFSQASQSAGRMQAERRLTEVSLRLLQARLNGPLPRALPADPKVSEDPFGTGLLRYVRNGRGFTVYSVGPDGTDDGGKVRSSSSSSPAYDLVATFK